MLSVGRRDCTQPSGYRQHALLYAYTSLYKAMRQGDLWVFVGHDKRITHNDPRMPLARWRGRGSLRGLRVGGQKIGS
jgi:hypothetical protein